METVEKIKNLTSVSSGIRSAFASFKKYSERQSHYDKKGFGFNLDNRFSACGSLELRVDSWVGVYGDSGCSRVLSVDQKIFNDHLFRVLSKDFENILMRVAESIEQEASQLKDKALSELAKKTEEISGLSTPTL